MGMRRVLSGILIIMLSMLCLHAPASAATYKYRYVDAKGEAHFANKEEEVPKEYKSSAMLVSVEEVDEKTQAAVEEERNRTAGNIKATEATARIRQATLPAAAAEPTKSMNLVWSGVAVVSVFAVMTLLGWIDVLREKEQVLNGIRTALFVLLAVYLVAAHGRDVLALFSRVGSSISTMEQESAERGKKAAQFYKSMETIVEQTDKMRQMQEAQMTELQENQ